MQTAGSSPLHLLMDYVFREGAANLDAVVIVPVVSFFFFYGGNVRGL